MPTMNVFKTTTSGVAPLDASTGTDDKPPVSDFLTVQSFANFAAMTGAITAAWHGILKLMPAAPEAKTLWIPYGLAFAWGVISVWISLDGLKTAESKKLELGTVAQAVFLALINAIVLGGAVVGTNSVTSP